MPGFSFRVLLLSALFLASPRTTAETVRYSYDQAGRLVAVEYGGGKTIRYTYDKSGNLLKRTVETGATSQASKQARRSETRTPAAKSRR
jgi:YD repeat-containing protein